MCSLTLTIYIFCVGDRCGALKKICNKTVKDNASNFRITEEILISAWEDGTNTVLFVIVHKRFKPDLPQVSLNPKHFTGHLET